MVGRKKRDNLGPGGGIGRDPRTTRRRAYSPTLTTGKRTVWPGVSPDGVYLFFMIYLLGARERIFGCIFLFFFFFLNNGAHRIWSKRSFIVVSIWARLRLDVTSNVAHVLSVFELATFRLRFMQIVRSDFNCSLSETRESLSDFQPYCLC